MCEGRSSQKCQQVSSREGNNFTIVELYPNVYLIMMMFTLLCPNDLLCCCVGEIMQIEENNNSILDANFTTVDTNYSYPLTMPSEIFQF